MLSAREALEFRDTLIARLRMHADRIAKIDQIDPVKPLHVAAAIQAASLVLWAPEMQLAATAGQEHFVGLDWNPDALVPPLQLWLLPHQKRIRSDVDRFLHENDYRLVAIMVGTQASEGGGMGCIFLLLPDSGVSKDRPPMMRAQELTGKIGESASNVAAMCGFMALDIVELERTRLTGADVRLCHSWKRTPPDIRTVVLRRKKFATASNSQSSIDWSCRWVVSGHWRRQWCPSINGHRPTFIEGYVKGPESKPLMAHTAERVYAVTR